MPHRRVARRSRGRPRLGRCRLTRKLGLPVRPPTIRKGIPRGRDRVTHAMIDPPRRDEGSLADGSRLRLEFDEP